MTPEPELCVKCDEPTGNAGPADGSIYCATCGEGPLCHECSENSADQEEKFCRKCAGTETPR